MQSPRMDVVYPRENDSTTVYLKSVVTNPNISVGEHTFYNDPLHDPRLFQETNVLYHYPINNDKISIGSFCSIACGARFLMNCANHTLASVSTFPFPLFGEHLGKAMDVTKTWDNKGDIVVGNDVWIGFEAVLLAGVHIGHGAIIGTRAVVTRDVPPYTIVGGIPAAPIRKRFPDPVIADLLELEWWNWPLEKIIANLDYIQSGDIPALQQAAGQ